MMTSRFALLLLPFAALEQHVHGRLGVYAVDLRTGVPPGWTVGDKTGTMRNGAQ